MPTKEEHVIRLLSRDYHWDVPTEAVRLIANAESCRLKAYKCPAGVWTIGWGETENVQQGMVWNEDQADSRFNQEINRYAREVSKLCTAYTNINQLGAFVSLAYNIGLGAFNKSSVLKRHNAGDTEAAYRSFNLWDKARVNGVLTTMPGLTSRRAAESALYLKPEEDDFEVIPHAVQAVAEESPLVKSPINKAGLTTVAIGGITGVSSIFDGALPIITSVKNVLSTIGVNSITALAVVLVVAGAASIYWRYKQREGGWA